MMGLFRKRSTSSTTSTKLKRPHRPGSLPPEVPAIPPAPQLQLLNQAQSKSSFAGPGQFARKELPQSSPNSNSHTNPNINPNFNTHINSNINSNINPTLNRNPSHKSTRSHVYTVVVPPLPQNAAMGPATSNEDGFSTPVSQVSGLTHPSDAAPARSTAPSSVDAMSAVSSFRKPVPSAYSGPGNGGGSTGPQMQLNGQRISTSTVPDDGFYAANAPRHRRPSTASAVGSEFDSRPSSMTVTGMGPTMSTGNRKPPPPPLRDNPSTSTLPQEWTERDPSINTRYTHSPTPSESASMQSSVVYPQQPQPQRRHHGQGPPPNKFRSLPHHLHHPAAPPSHLQNPNRPRFGSRPPLPHQYRPNSASQRLPIPHPPPRFYPPPPLTPRSNSFRQTPQNMLPSLPENRRAHTLPLPNIQNRPNIPPTPGPKSLALTITSNHIECNIRHEVLLPMKNYHHPVPCLTCRRLSIDGMQYCSFCALRICKDCAVRLKKEWNGDITKGWGGVTPAVEEFSSSVGPGARMVAGWGDHSPPIPARSAANQLVWPTRTNTERVSSLLGVPYRPKTAPSLITSFQRNTEPDTSDDMERPQFNFESNVDLESGPSTISPPSPVTPPAFGGSGSSHRLPLTLPNDHRLPLALSNDKHHFEASGGYGYATPSPEIVSDSNPELVQPRPHYHVDAANILNTDPMRRPRTYNSYTGPPPPPIPMSMPPSMNGSNRGGLYRTETERSSTTVGKNSTVRPVTGSTIAARGSIFDSVKTSGEEKKKKKGLMGLFSKK
ncbi:hypothetical protein ABW20_dc0107040 [Dactylellina cionopaga]|nr:hypothetical protein ABW20_dc0107040 [Dactylellina cionopaga]